MDSLKIAHFSGFRHNTALCPFCEIDRLRAELAKEKESTGRLKHLLGGALQREEHKDNRIAELEEQLAEKDRRISELGVQFADALEFIGFARLAINANDEDELEVQLSRRLDEVGHLRAELAEKDRRISELAAKLAKARELTRDLLAAWRESARREALEDHTLALEATREGE